MPVKRKIPWPDGVYSIPTTCCEWISLIEKTNGYDLIYNWFDILKKEGHFINGYVIMPNHLHALLAFRNTGQLINNIIGNGKRFIAYEIISRLEQQGDHMLLNQLNSYVKPKDRSKGKKYEVWEDSFDWKECNSIEFINQKLDYMHNNPCKGRWQLIKSPVDYEHSSARFYQTGIHAAYPVTNYMELEDINLSKLFIK